MSQRQAMFWESNSGLSLVPCLSMWELSKTISFWSKVFVTDSSNLNRQVAQTWPLDTSWLNTIQEISDSTAFPNCLRALWQVPDGWTDAMNENVGFFENQSNFRQPQTTQGNNTKKKKVSHLERAKYVQTICTYKRSSLLPQHVPAQVFILSAKSKSQWKIWSDQSFWIWLVWLMWLTATAGSSYVLWFDSNIGALRPWKS